MDSLERLIKAFVSAYVYDEPEKAGFTEYERAFVSDKAEETDIPRDDIVELFSAITYGHGCLFNPHRFKAESKELVDKLFEGEESLYGQRMMYLRKVSEGTVPIPAGVDATAGVDVPNSEDGGENVGAKLLSARDEIQTIGFASLAAKIISSYSSADLVTTWQGDIQIRDPKFAMDPIKIEAEQLEIPEADLSVLLDQLHQGWGVVRNPEIISSGLSQLVGMLSIVGYRPIDRRIDVLTTLASFSCDRVRRTDKADNPDKPDKIDKKARCEAKKRVLLLERDSLQIKRDKFSATAGPNKE